MRFLKKFLLILTMSFLITTASSAQETNLTITQIDSPAASGSAAPNLSGSSDGRVYLTWIEPLGENRRAVRFSVLVDNKWANPRTIVEAENLLSNWADFPSIVALQGGELVAHWLVKNSGDLHAYDINISRSSDGGTTWSKPIMPHRDGTATEHGFVSMLPRPEGRIGLVWLDGRNFQGKSHGHQSQANEMTLRYAVVDAKGQLSQEAVLDSRVCECCQTSAALTSDGAIAVYRDRSEKEIRDISFVRLIDGRWTQPRQLSFDGWEINGCPVNGPSIAAKGRAVAVAWFTAAKEIPQVKVIFSNDGGSTFAQAIVADDGSPIGRVDVSVLADGSALICWLEKTSKGGEIKVRRVYPNGTREISMTVAESSTARVSGFPQMVTLSEQVIFAWTDPSTPSRVRTAVAS